jgi:hypothetical protein
MKEALAPIVPQSLMLLQLPTSLRIYRLAVRQAARRPVHGQSGRKEKRPHPAMESSREEQQGGASAPTQHSPRSRPYKGDEFLSLIGKNQNRLWARSFGPLQPSLRSFAYKQFTPFTFRFLYNPRSMMYTLLRGLLVGIYCGEQKDRAIKLRKYASSKKLLRN